MGQNFTSRASARVPCGTRSSTSSRIPSSSSGRVSANSSGGSKRLTEKFPRFLFKGNFEPGFATALAAKDVRLATDLGREYGIPMELSNLVDQRHVEALFRGWGPEDSDAVAKIQEEKSGIQLRLPE